VGFVGTFASFHCSELEGGNTTFHRISSSKTKIALIPVSGCSVEILIHHKPFLSRVGRVYDKERMAAGLSSSS